MTVVPHRPRRPLRLRLGSWLLALGLATAMPVMLVAVAGVVDQVRVRDEDAQAALRRRATSASRTIAQELQAVTQTLRSVAQYDSVGRGDLAGLHAFATRLAALDPRLDAIQLVERGGRMPFTTAAAFGTPLPPVPRETLAGAVERGAPFVSPVSVDPVTGRPQAAVVLPLDVRGLGPCVLRAVVKADALAHALNQHVWPPDWTAAVVDQDFAVVVRSADGDRLAGQPAHPSVRPQVEAGRSDFDAQALDGTPVRVHVSPVPGTRWTTAVAVPLSGIDNPAWRAGGTLLAAAGMCLAIGLALSRLLARVVARDARALAAAQARRYAEGVPDVHVTELAELGAALRATWPAAALPAASPDAEAATVPEAATAAETATVPGAATLRQAEDDTRDAVTGLPVRDSLLARAQSLARRATRPGDSLAVLFVDVDGVPEVTATCGAEAGTTVLRHVADVLRRHAGGQALAGRLGPERFLLCAAVPRPQVVDAASELARRILQETRVIGLGVDCRVTTAFAHDPARLRALLEPAQPPSAD